MKPWVALLAMDVRAMSRERWLWATMAFMPLLGGVAPALDGLSVAFTEALEAAGPPPEDDAVVLCIEGDPRLPRAAFDGEPPSWLEWPGGWTPLAEADVLIDRVPGTLPTIRVVGLTPDVDLREADDCVWNAIYEARADRLEDQLGITERPGIVTRVTWIAPTPDDEPPAGIEGMPLLATTGLLSAMLFGAGVLLDLLPRRRRTGLLEMLRGTRARGSDLVLSAMILALLATAFGQLLLLAGLGLGNLLNGTLAHPGPWPVALVPAWLGLLSSALIMMKGVRDMRASALSLMALMTMWTLLGLMAYAVSVENPWWAATIPLGGALIASVGVLSTGPSLLASAVSTGAAVATMAWGARSLDREDHAGGQLDPTLIRRAHGHFGPEVALLFAVGLGGAALVQGGMAAHPWPSLVTSQVLFHLVPAMITPLALGLPMSALLPLGRPRAVELGAAVPVGLGLIGGSSLALAVATRVLPSGGALLEQFGQMMSELSTGPGILLIGLVPAVCEEALFRGAIQGLLSKGRRPAVAIVLQAALFALFHVLPLRWAPTFVSGLALGWLRHRTGSLIPGAVAHATLNIVAVALPWGRLEAGSQEIVPVSFCLFLVFLWFYRNKSAPRSSS